MGPDAVPSLLPGLPSTQAPGVGYLYAAASPVPRAPRPAAPPPAPGRSPWARGAQRVAAVGLVSALALVGQSSPVGNVVALVGRTLDTPASPVAGADGFPTVGGLVLAAQQSGLVLPVPGPGAPGAPSGPPQHVDGVGDVGDRLGLVPAPVLAAYRAGATYANSVRPGCGLSWSVLAGIGEIESGHAAAGGSGRPGWDGTASPPILGPVLDGRTPGTAVIPDSDGGRLDGDRTHDRAVGPMQFLPSTWAAYAVDGNGDGVSDPQHVADAAAAAGLYLCSGGTDLTDARQLHAALLRYNRSTRYARAVLAGAGGYLAASLGPTPAGVAQAAVAFAWKSLGDPYLWGGNGPYYDCSGLTTAAYRSAGVLLPRTAGEQWQQVPAVPLSQLVVGDLVFFSMGLFRPDVPGHVGIYLGNGLMINSPRTGAFVRIDRIDRPGIVSAARPSLLATYAGAPAPGTGLVLPEVAEPAVPLPVVRPTPTSPASASALPTTTTTTTPSGLPSLSPSPSPSVLPSVLPVPSVLPAPPTPGLPSATPSVPTAPLPPAPTSPPAPVPPTTPSDPGSTVSPLPAPESTPEDGPDPTGTPVAPTSSAPGQ